MSLIWLNSLCPFINVGRGRDGNSASALSNTRCRQMVSKILIFWKWVLPWLCLISAFQTPTSYKWNDTCPFAFYAVNWVLRFGFWQSEFGFQIVKVPVFRHNNSLQNPTDCKIQPTSPYSKLSSPRAETAVTGRWSPHSGEGEDFLMGQLNFFAKTAVTPERKVEKSIPRWKIKRYAEG